MQRRTFTKGLVVGGLGIVLGIPARGARAQEPVYTFEVIDIPPISASPQEISLMGITHDGTMLGDENGTGGVSSRITPDLVPQPIIPSNFERYPFAVRSGPQMTGINGAHTVVGHDEGVHALHGVRQTADGAATFLLMPDSLGTLLVGVNDAEEAVGHFWDTTPSLLKFHAFSTDGNTTTTLERPSPSTVVFPTGINLQGTVIGYLFQDVQPDNSHVYQAFYRDTSGYHPLDGPEGQDLWLTSVNNAGVITGVYAQQNGVIGGQAFLYDTITETFTALPLPTATATAMLPTGINDHGHLVGLFIDQGSVLQFRAVSTPPVVNVPDDGGKKRRKKPRWRKQRRFVHRFSRHTVRQPFAVRGQWSPVLDDDGTVCLTNGQQVIGRKRH